MEGYLIWHTTICVAILATNCETDKSTITGCIRWGYTTSDGG
jgi:hypothetical protein